MSSFWGSKPAAAAAPAEVLPELPRTAIVNSEETVKDIPAEYVADLDAKIDILFAALSPNGQGFDQFLDKEGVVGKKRVVDGLPAVKAEAIFPQNIVDVFQTLTSSPDQIACDTMKKEQLKLKVFSKHSWIEYFAVKGIWPVSGRDFVDFTNWRLAEDGSVVIISYSVTSELKPDVKDSIRGNTVYTGYILTPKPEGTHVLLTILSDPKGSLPTAIQNQAAMAQAGGLLEAKKLIAKKTDLKPLDAPATYDDFVAAAAKNL